MTSRGAVRVALVGLSLFVAGCVQGNTAKAIDPTAAPVWEAGYTWTYDVISSSHESVVESGRVDGDTDRNREVVTVTVFNTTTTLLGEDVYYVRLSQSVDHPLFEGTIQALTKDSLSIAGRAWNDHYAKPAPPRPVAVSDDLTYAVPPEPYNPCDGVVTIYPTPPEERFPALRFPLDDGNTWTDEILEPEDDFVSFHYTGRTHGLVEVTVPAGTFSAIYATVDLVPVLPDEAEQYGEFKFRAKAEYWYSPDAQNLVKSLVSFSGQASMRGEPQSFQFGYTSTMSLRSYNLEAGPDEPAPMVQEDGARYEPTRGWEIVADKPVPLNVADGPRPVTFALAASDHGPPRYDGQPRVATPLPSSGLDPEAHRIYWRLLPDYESWNFVDGFGDTFTYNFTDGGAYRIEANVQPLKCGGSWLGSAQTSVATFWEKTYKVAMDLGLPRTVEVGRFPVVQGAREGKVAWTMTPASVTLLDNGRPILYEPSGRTVAPAGASTSGSFPFTPYATGSWRLVWESSRPTVGDDVSLTLRVEYGDMIDYIGH